MLREQATTVGAGPPPMANKDVSICMSFFCFLGAFTGHNFVNRFWTYVFWFFGISGRGPVTSAIGANQS